MTIVQILFIVNALVGIEQSLDWAGGLSLAFR